MYSNSENRSFYTSSLAPCDCPRTPLATGAGKGNRSSEQRAHDHGGITVPVAWPVLRFLLGNHPQTPRKTHSWYLPRGREKELVLPKMEKANL